MFKLSFRILILFLHGLFFQVTSSSARPQDPVPPFPYHIEEVTFYNEVDSIHLAGTLTYPDTNGPFTAAILISGSGQQDRDETIAGHKPFWIIADCLTRRGIAVLRYDDRGVYGSEGDPTNDTSEDFSRDVIAAVEYLNTRHEIDPGKIGLIGHSEGGLIAPMVANQWNDIAFIVMMAGPGLPGDEILILQGELLERASGVPETVIQQTKKLRQGIYNIAKTESNDSVAFSKIKTFIRNFYPGITETQVNAIANEFSVVLMPWFRFYLAYDPRPALQSIHCPVLAINGGKDLQVPAKENLSEIEKALTSGGNTDFTVHEFSNLNHLFQNAVTGSVTEYEQIDETIEPAILDMMGNWIVQQMFDTSTNRWYLY